MRRPYSGERTVIAVKISRGTRLIRQHLALKRHLLRASLYRKQLDDLLASLHRLTELTQDPSAF
ncbi:IS element transposase [Caballeronia udeis]|uniref:IS element transposase n=1 Tax=Caballeronia udeis TaxID=1232866 RepID=A0A158FXD5_9BURK|nr:IS element transposase [Caballeronia udeis]